MSKKPQNKFNGFEQSNTTPVPDVLFDELLSELSGSELKVLLYIIRRTKGFKKDSDAISLTQFEHGIVTQEGKVLDRGCGLKDRETICKALKSLEGKGCIKSEKRTTNKGDNDTTVYSIRFKGEVVGKTDQGSRKNRLPNVVGKTAYGSRKNPKRVVGKTDPQQTVIQQTVIQQTEGESELSTTGKNGSFPSPQNQSSLSSEKKTLSPEVVAILDCWDEIRGSKVPRSDKQKKAAKELAEVDATKEQIKAVEQFCLQDNPEWYAVHGIDLQSISNNWSKWQTAQEHKGKSVKTSSKTTKHAVSSYDDDDFIDDTFYPTRRVEARHGTH